MIRLPESLKAWGTPEFREVFKQEFERVEAVRLPLQQGLARSSYVSERPFQVITLGTHEEAGRIQIKAAVYGKIGLI